MLSFFKGDYTYKDTETLQVALQFARDSIDCPGDCEICPYYRPCADLFRIIQYLENIPYIPESRPYRRTNRPRKKLY